MLSYKEFSTQMVWVIPNFCSTMALISSETPKDWLHILCCQVRILLALVN